MLNNKGRVTGQREIRPVWNNAQRVNHQNKFTHPHPKRNFVPMAFVTKSGQVPVNTAKQSSPRAATSISTARPVNTNAPKSKVNDALPKTYFYFKAHLPVRRAFNKKSAAKTYNLNEKVKTAKVNNVTTARPKAVVSATVGYRENAVKSSACWIWRPTGNIIDHTSKDSGSYMFKRFDYGNPQYTLQDQGIFDNGCSRHMTGNKSFLTDYQEVDVGFVAFPGSPKGGKITRKGKIRTRKLDFKDVYFVKKLKFNLFSVSKMCDKKNSVLFTETECLVLSPDFKLLDESSQTEQHNRVLVTKPHNKTPYELLHGRPPSISFMRPFGCPVTILNTVDLLGKFDRKADEGFFVGYSINSKAFKVFNTRTRKVEENLHITFIENKPNVAGSRPDWLFDIDFLTNSMNYEPVTAGNQTNKKAVTDDAGKKTNKEPANEGERNGHDKEGGASNKEINQNVQDFRAELDNLLVQQKEGYANNTNRDSIVGPSVSTAGQNITNTDDLPTDPLIPDLEDTGIFSGAYDDEDMGAEADLNNFGITMNVSPIPTTRIHKDHPKDQIIGDINSATQTMRMTFKKSKLKKHEVKQVQQSCLGEDCWELCIPDLVPLVILLSTASSIPDEYLLKFHNVADAKSLWEAIKSRFGGNVESKKMQKNVLKHQFENFSTASNENLDKAYDRFQKLISQLEVHGAPISKEDINQKFLRSLPPSWNQIALIMRNKPDIDEIDIDDLYNNLRVYEDELKRSSGSNSASQNLAFLSSENTSSTNEVSTASGDFGVSTAGGINQMDGDDLEELDLRWQVAMLTVRILKVSRRDLRVSMAGEQCTTNESSYKLMVAQDEVSTKNLDEILNSQMSARDKTGLGYDTQLNELSSNHETDSENSLSIFDARSSDEENTPENDRFSKNRQSRDRVNTIMAVVGGIVGWGGGGASSHMTGNNAYLSDYEDFNGGFVAFGSDPKGDELNFKLLDESQVVLRSPRKDDVYNLDLKNIIPSGGITCLYANAIADESKLGYREI
ncbi:retrovirus-related pol polyprotein from transposon TNT 1-94 [Tanacetum coccineum]